MNLSLRTVSALSSFFWLIFNYPDLIHVLFSKLSQVLKNLSPCLSVSGWFISLLLINIIMH